MASKEHKSALDARRKAAPQRAQDVVPIIIQLRAEGAISLRQIAERLNARGVPAPKGGRWTAVQVIRVQARMPSRGPKKLHRAVSTAQRSGWTVD